MKHQRPFKCNVEKGGQTVEHALPTRMIFDRNVSSFSRGLTAWFDRRENRKGIWPTIRAKLCTSKEQISAKHVEER